MSCEQIGCQSDVFSSCSNHCTKQLCLKHVVEHGDAFLKNFVVAIDQLENISHLLIDQLNLATAKVKSKRRKKHFVFVFETFQIAERRQIELDRIQSFYDEKQFYLRQQNLFAENADRLIKKKSESNCRSNQHDFEQLKIYAKQIDKYLIKNEEIKPIECKKKLVALSDTALVVCPLMQPNAYGMRLEHDLRFGCQSGPQTRFTLLQHCEYYHRMLPECAARLRDAVFAGQPIDTVIFSPNETLKVSNKSISIWRNETFFLRFRTKIIMSIVL